VRRWWAGRRGEVTVAEIDLRVGGAWRYALVAEGGFEVAFHGTYREIIPNERIVTTEVYEGEPIGGVTEEEAKEGALNNVSFDRVDGRTTLSILVECPSQRVRDAIIDSGMEAGMQEGMDLLEEVAISLR
jgi:uncharacterized protein YndB with AHSA1/START domain